MSSYAEITTQVADQWVAALKTTGEVVAKLTANAQEATDNIATPSLPEPFAKLGDVLAESLPKPEEIVEANFDFTTRLLEAQRDLALNLLTAVNQGAKSAEA